MVCSKKKIDSENGGHANDRTLYSEENRSGGFEYQIVNCPDFRLIVTLANNSATITYSL